MKLLTLLIEPFRLDAVRQQYEDAGVNGMTVCEASAVGGGHTERYRGSAVPSAGRIWVTPVDQVVRVRTGERGAEAV